MSLLTPKNLNFEDRLDQIRYLLIWRLSIVLFLFLSALSVAFYFDAQDTFLSYVFATSISIFAIIFLRVAKRYQIVFFIYAIGGTLIINLSMIYILDAPHLTDFLWILLGVLLAYFGLGIRWGLFFMILNFFPVSYFLLYRLNDHIEQLPTQSQEETIILTIEVIGCMTLISYIIYQFVKVNKLVEHDLVERNKVLRERNDLIEKSNEENTVLVKEIHHRVKNNLQIIISLLRLQMTDIKSSDGKKHFSEAINRVMVMSTIHQKLYRQDDISNFDLQDYIDELATELKQFFAEEKDITMDVQTQIKDIDLKTIVPLGLILNELLSNSFKYAFKDRSEGTVRILIEDMDSYFQMKYSDNGVWKEVSPESNGFGLELIETLTEQLNGTSHRSSDVSGTKYTFELQKLNDN